MYSCDTCHISFDDELTSVQHHKEFHSIGGRNEGQCMLCNVRFPSFPRFAEHFKKSHRKQTKLLTKGLHSKNDFPWLLKVAFREHGGGALSMDEMMDKNRQQLMQMGYESDDSEEDEDSGDIEIVASSPAPTEAFLDDNEAEMDDGVIELTEEQEMKPRTKMSTTEELQKLYHEDRANENESIPIGRKREQPLDPPVTVKRSRGLSSLDPNIPYAKALNSSSSQKPHFGNMHQPIEISVSPAATDMPILHSPNGTPITLPQQGGFVRKSNAFGAAPPLVPVPLYDQQLLSPEELSELLVLPGRTSQLQQLQPQPPPVQQTQLLQPFTQVPTRFDVWNGPGQWGQGSSRNQPTSPLPHLQPMQFFGTDSPISVNGMMPPAKVSMGGATTTNPFTSNVSVPDAGHTNAVPMTRIDLKEMLERQKNIIIHFPPDWTDDERRKTFQAIQAVANEKSAGAQ